MTREAARAFLSTAVLTVFAFSHALAAEHGPNWIVHSDVHA